MMDDVIQLIHHLIKSKYSIDKIDSIANRLKFSRERIQRILRADRYKDYFQFIRTKNQGTEKIALTIDVSSFSILSENHQNQSLALLLYTLCSTM